MSLTRHAGSLASRCRTPLRSGGGPHHRTLWGIVVFAVLLVVLSAVPASTLVAPSSGTTGSIVRSPPTAATASPAASPAAATAPASPLVGSPAACDAGAPAGAPPPLPASAAPIRTDGPLYNSQVEPYAVLTGPYAYVAGGAALRDQGYGIVNLTWPGFPSTANVVGAYLIWSIMDDVEPPAFGTLNGAAIVGTWVAYASPSPCWAPPYIYTFIADVTPLVVNGANVLTGFPSGVTNGLDPWGEPQVDPMDEGASLVVVYQNGGPAIEEVAVYTGALTLAPGTLTATLDYPAAASTVAETTYIVEDGQLSGNAAIWNGVTIDGNAFPGGDPKQSAAGWSAGNLSDTRTYDVTVPLGSTASVAQIYGGDDCLTWAGQVLATAVQPGPAPYPVGFVEQGLPDGTTWNVTINGVTAQGTVVDQNSSIGFNLPNGTYGYTIGSPRGYSTRSSGTIVVDGGPVLVRVPFHAATYTVQFDATGLPAGMLWSVELNGTSVGSDTDSLAFVEPNGTYPYSVQAPPDFLAVPDGGTLNVFGADLTQVIGFVKITLYDVTFTETGLPAAGCWSVAYNGTNGSSSSGLAGAGEGIVLTIRNGSYVFDAPSWCNSNFYAPLGTFVVHGGPVSVVVAFHEEVYVLSVHEVGLPASKLARSGWTVVLNGTVVHTVEPALSFSEPNGTYPVLITGPAGYQAGTYDALTVRGTTTVTVTMSKGPTRALAFAKKGLPKGTSLCASVNDYLQCTARSSLKFSDLTPGDYSYAIDAVAGGSITATVGKTTIPTSGSIAVAKNTKVVVHYHRAGDALSVATSYVPVASAAIAAPVARARGLAPPPAGGRGLAVVALGALAGLLAVGRLRPGGGSPLAPGRRR